MPAISRILKLSLILLMVVLSVTACKRQRAENSLKKTTSILQEMEDLNGSQYAGEEIQQIRQLVNNANSQLQTNPDAALTTAQTAKSQAEQVLIEVKGKAANDLWTQAEEEIDVASFNELDRRDPDRFSRINEIKREADTAKTENRWEDVINLSREIIQEVQTGLAPLRTEAERKRIEADSKLLRLKQIGGSVYAPLVVIAVQDQINNAKNTAEQDRDYILATNQFTEAIRQAEAGIEQVRREQAREKIDTIEELIATALLEGAKAYNPQEYNDVVRINEGLNVDYAEGKYTRVIEGAELLQPRAQALVINTKRAAADDRIRAMRKNIQQLVDGGINEYLPGMINRLQGILEQAQTIRQRDSEQAFDEIKALSTEADDEYERLIAAFSAKARDAITEARNTLDVATSVFQQAQGIFEPIEGEMTPEQTAFENQKQIRLDELNQALQNAAADLGRAELRHREEDFEGAIVLAREVENRAEAILNEVYHVVAHNASIELANLITRYERDGAREYAQEELQRATQELEEVKQLIGQNEFRRAVQQAAEARAEIELMAQRIAGRATVNIREARSALQDATSERTRRYRNSMLEQVSELIAQAENDLQTAKLKSAVERANQATTLARQAKTEAAREAAQENIAQAEDTISRAQAAGAGVYAGRILEDSKKLLEQARNLYQSEDYEKALDLARSAANRSQNALYNKINEAEAAVANAKAVGGWEYDDTRLAQANTQIREARTAIDQRQYQRSHELADSARKIASALTKDSKNHNFDQRVQRIRMNLAKGEDQGVKFFQPEETIEIYRRLNEVQNMYTPSNYELIQAELDKLESKLRETLNTTDSLVYTVADQQERRAQALMAEGAALFGAVEINEALDLLEFARLDYQRELYKNAHSNLSRAIELIDMVSLRKQQKTYMENIEELFQEYQHLQLQFQNVLTLDPVELKELAVGPAGASKAISVSAQINPNEYRSGVDRLYSQALTIQAPQGMAQLHEDVIIALAEGRQAAMNFEKLVILNRMSNRDAEALIDQAYSNVNSSNRIVSAVQRDINRMQMNNLQVESGVNALVKQ